MKLTKLLAALFIAALLITPAASADVKVEPGDGAGSIIIKNPDSSAKPAPSDPSDREVNRVDGYNSIAIGNGAFVIDIDNDDPDDEDFDWNSKGNGSIAMGYNALVQGAYGVAIGDRAEAQMKSVALGNKAKALEQYSVAIGSGAESTNLSAYSLGNAARASGNRSYAVGYESVSSFESAFAFGTYAQARHEFAYALGYRADASGQFAYAIGYNAKATAHKSLALGYQSVATEEDTISVGYDGTDDGINYAAFQRRIVNLDEGINDTDAVNVNQLKRFGESVATAFGGEDGAWSFTDGALTGQFTIKDNTFSSIQDAFDYLANGWKFEATNDGASGGSGTADGGGNTGGSTAGSSNIGPGDTLTLNGGNNIKITSDGGEGNKYTVSVVDNPKFSEITVGDKVNISSSGISTGGTNISMGGGKITGLADGGVYEGSKDAVNGGQLWDAYQRMDSMGNDIYRRMDDLREDVNIVGAHAAALSGLHPIDYNPYEPTTLSAAVGTYRDEYAVAVGVFHYTRENVMFNLGASLCSDGDLMGRAGVSFTVGKSSDKPKVAGTMNGLRNQVIAMQAKLDELEKQNARNEDIIRQNMELIRELKAELDAKR